MAKFCSNCGKKVDELAVICVNCGVPIANISATLDTQVKEKKGKGIASMILGIVSVVYAIMAFSAMGEFEVMIAAEGYSVAVAVGAVLIQMSTGIVGLCLGVSERKKKKNGFNGSGFWLSIIGIAISTIQFIMVVSMG
jgi:Predicted membrane protein